MVPTEGVLANQERRRHRAASFHFNAKTAIAPKDNDTLLDFRSATGQTEREMKPQSVFPQRAFTRACCRNVCADKKLSMAAGFWSPADARDASSVWSVNTDQRQLKKKLFCHRHVKDLWMDPRLWLARDAPVAALTHLKICKSQQHSNRTTVNPVLWRL